MKWDHFLKLSTAISETLARMRRIESHGVITCLPTVMTVGSLVSLADVHIGVLDERYVVRRRKDRTKNTCANSEVRNEVVILVVHVVVRSYMSP